MSDLLQSRNYSGDEHPDADQLNAFVEQALSEHERIETLAHLADCASCREIVMLSLPPLEDAAAEEPVILTPSRSKQPAFISLLAGFFSGWKLVWIAVPALAALVILTVHFRGVPAGQQEDQATGQMAEAHPPVQPAAPSSEAKPDAAPVTPATKPMTGAATEAAPSKAGKSIGGPVLLQHHTADMARSVEPAAPKPGGMALGFLRPPSQSGGSSSMASAPASRQYVQPLPPTVQNNHVAVSSANSAAITANAQNSQMDLAVSGREATRTAPLTAPQKSTYLPVQAPLPNGLAILSLARNVRQLVALDTRHQLFLSEDEGQHWKAVSVPWQARAIRVTTISSGPTVANSLGSTIANGAAFAVPERYTPGATASVQRGQGPGANGGVLSGSVMDASGAVIAGATVVATDNHTSLTRTVQTDAGGRYLVDELPPGDYRLEVRAAGFQKQSQMAVLSPPQQTVTNVVLTIGQSSQTVEVQSSQMSQLQTTSRVDSIGAAKMKKPVGSSSVNRAPVFAVTTDTGDRWTSSDGQVWTQAAR